MENLDDSIPNKMPPDTGGAYNPDDDLPASPEDVGVEHTPPEPAEEAPEIEEFPQAETAPDNLEDTGSIAHPGGDEPQDQGEPGDLEFPSEEEPPDEPDSPTPSDGKGRPRFSWLIASLLGLLILLVIAAISAFGGYQSGISVRQQAEGTQLAGAVEQQYELGVQDLEAGNYFRARQRLEYVINLNPDYPGAAEKLAAVLYELNTTATPTLVPTATLTPTPDMRGEQELFDQGQESLRNGEWDNAIETLLTLRKADPDFYAVQVDGMLFVALRNRGKDKILLEQDLEGGIYDLTLAERFGVLDTEADGLLSWTRLYITGASFWQIDWGQSVYYFGQVAPHLPNLMDKSGFTAGERYRISLIEYGYYLAEQKQWCKSFEQFQLALSLGYDAQTEQDMNTAAERYGRAGKNKQLMDTPFWALTLAYWLHMLATVIWIGGLAALALFVIPAARRTLPAQGFAELLEGLQRRLDPWSWFSLAILLATGMLQMSANPNYDGFMAFNNRWAVAILVKHILFLGMAALSAYITWGLIPRLRRLSLRLARAEQAEIHTEMEKLLKQEGLLIKINLVLGFLVLALTAIAPAA